MFAKYFPPNFFRSKMSVFGMKTFSFLPKTHCRQKSGYRYFKDKNQPSKTPLLPISTSFSQYSSTSWKSKKIIIFAGLSLFGGSLYIATHIETVADTGRKRIMIVSPQKEQLEADRAYRSILAMYRNSLIPESHPFYRLVFNVATKLISANQLYYDSNSKPIE
eukprot:Sdes_comp20749_c0_seq3m16654